MQLNTTYLDSWSTPSSTMTRYIIYKDTLFEQANLTLILGKPTFETLHKIWNKIKSNAKSVYSNIGGGEHGNLGLVITNAQYTLISLTPFAYPNHPGPLIITDGTTAHGNSNMWIAHTEEVRLFYEVTGVEQALVQQIVGTVEEVYLADIRNRNTDYINNTVVGVLTHLKENGGRLMTHELLEREEILNKTIYNPRDPITTVLYAVK